MAQYKMDIVDVNLNTGNIHRSFLSHTIGQKDEDADRFGVRAFRDGVPVDLSGCSCHAWFLNSQGTTLALTDYGTVDGNEAYVTLPQACYDYDGQFCLAIKLVGGGISSTVRIIDGVVDNIDVGGSVSPTSEIPDYSAILSQYAAMVAATSAANTAIAETFDATKAYPTGKYVINTGALYRLTADHAANVTWANTSKVACNIGDETSDLKSALDENDIPTDALSPTLYSSCGIYSNGMVYGLSGYNVYVYDVANIDYVAVNGGSIYAFYATLPVVNSTQSIDAIRHIRTLSNVTLKVPYGANYIGIRHTSEPVVKNGDTMKSNIDRLEYLKAFNTKNVSYTKTGYFINLYGTDIANADYSCTDYIEITGESIIKIHTFFTGNARHALYDADKNLIATIENAGSIGDVLTINTTANTKYIRFSINISYIDDEYAGIMFIANDIASIIKPNERTAYNGYEINVFKHGICIGDSLTAGTFNYMDGSTEKSDYVVAGYSYPVQLSKMTGIEIYVSAVGGQTSYEWYLDHTGATIAGFDFAIIQFGVNDALEYHDWTSDSITGFNGIINLLKAANEGIKIFVSTIIPALAYQGDAFNHVNSGIRELVASYNNDGDDNVILLDMALYANTKLKQYNAGHLTALGYSRLAKDYMNYISWYIKENPEQFRAVQFIGTDKEIPSVYE